jgi:hypothetical protein
MNMILGIKYRIRRFFPLLLVVLLTGCATPRIDWTARVGNYTYDQAVLELGPPDKQAKLADSTVIAEWLTWRGHRQIYAPPACSYPYWGYGPLYTGYVDSYSPDYYLRLVFGADGKLRAWKKFTR